MMNAAFVKNSAPSEYGRVSASLRAESGLGQAKKKPPRDNATATTHLPTPNESAQGSVPPNLPAVPSATQRHEPPPATQNARMSGAAASARLPTPSASSQGATSPAPVAVQPAAQPTLNPKPRLIPTVQRVHALIEAAGGRTRMLPEEEPLLDFPEMANTPAMKSVISGLMSRARENKVENLTREVRDIRLDMDQKRKEEALALAQLRRFDSRAAQALTVEVLVEAAAQPTGDKDGLKAKMNEGYAGTFITV